MIQIIISSDKPKQQSYTSALEDIIVAKETEVSHYITSTSTTYSDKT